MRAYANTITPLAVLAVAVAVGLSFQGTRGLYETTESRYAECAREMLETGNWLVPQLDGKPHWTKPPLSYWAIAGGMALLGVNEWGARLAGAAAFILSVWVIMQLGALLWDRPVGWLAGLIYATAPFVAGAANTISTDTLLTLWMLLVVFAYWKARRSVSGGRSGRTWVLLLWVFAGLAFMTKGPPALLALLVVAVSHLIDCRQGRPVPRLLWPWGLPAFLIVGLGWYVWAALTHPGLVGYWLGDEVVGRIGTDEFGRNTEWYKPLLIYLPPLAVGLGLWVVVAAGPVFRQARSLWRDGIMTGLRDRPALRFHLLWIVVPLVVLSVSRSRLPLYVLPLLPAVALVLARCLVAGCSLPRLRRVAIVVGVLSMVLVIGGKAATAYLPSAKDERLLYEVVQKHAGRQVQVINCTNRELYGLEFYFGGGVEQASLRGTEKEIADIIRHLVTRVANRPAGLSYAILTRRKDLRIADALDDQGVDYERLVIRQGAVTVVVGKPVATDVRTAGHVARKG
ncbi:MAG: phospholipid carrier-dependent glycosyltransferase [Anaerolineaceae bacterium]|nr:phospholipid carrier-dependent glycosyltransferase [Anaerolineaceae bacterium]